jgi:hypothetical protein
VASTTVDEVIGTYNDFAGVKVQVYKNGNQKYSIGKLSSAPFPEFTFQLKLNLFGLISYDVPHEGNVIRRFQFRQCEAKHRFEFTIKENSGAEWV